MKVFLITLLAIFIVPAIFAFFQKKSYESDLKSDVSARVSEVMAEEGLEGLDFELDHLDVAVTGSVEAENLDKIKALKQEINEMGSGEVRLNEKGFDVTINGDLGVAKTGEALIFSGHVNSLDSIKSHLGDGASPLKAEDSPELLQDDLYTDSPVASSVELKSWSDGFLALNGDRGYVVSAKDDTVKPYGKVTPSLKNKFVQLAQEGGLEIDPSGLEVVKPTLAEYDLSNAGGAVSLKGKGPVGYDAKPLFGAAQAEVSEDDFTEIHPSIKSPKFGKWAKSFLSEKGDKGIKIVGDSVTMTGVATPSLQRGWMGQLKSLGVKPASKLSIYPSEYHYPGYQSESGLDAGKSKSLLEAFTLNQIFFDSGDSSVREDQQPKITALDEAIKAAGDDAKFIIGGHADATGNVELNQALSQKRAKSVVAALAAKGIAEDRFTITSFGAAKASSGGSSESDRKVEILLK